MKAADLQNVPVYKRALPGVASPPGPGCAVPRRRWQTSRGGTGGPDTEGRGAGSSEGSVRAEGSLFCEFRGARSPRWTT